MNLSGNKFYSNSFLSIEKGLACVRERGQPLARNRFSSRWLISPLSRSFRPNLRERRVGEAAKVFSYLRVRTGCMLPRKKDPIPPIGWEEITFPSGTLK